ncbi:MAG: DUF4265 domain-containing protein [Blastocatellia bacterium]|nr:DUF4265 domain-containing protein [Blastocatellia bacterium]
MKFSVAAAQCTLARKEMGEPAKCIAIATPCSMPAAGTAPLSDLMNERRLSIPWFGSSSCRTEGFITPPDRVVHQNPIWRDKADFIIAAYLGKKDDRNEWEQLWALRVGEGRFLICCIPFFASDLALGDEVETDADHTVLRVVVPSGQETFRVWFGDSTCPGIREEVVRHMESQTVAVEWSSENLLALSASNEEQAQSVADYLHSRQVAGHLLYETGRAK